MSKKKIKYTDEPIGEVKIVKDFLPAGDECFIMASSNELAFKMPYSLLLSLVAVWILDSFIKP